VTVADEIIFVYKARTMPNHHSGRTATLQGRRSLNVGSRKQEREPSVTVTVPRQNTATLSVLVDDSQSVRFDRTMDLSSELVCELTHVLHLYLYDVLIRKMSRWM
jgi:hypothetical protein